MSQPPTGFVPRNDEELDPNGKFDPETDLAGFDRLPCVLYTDYTGINYFVIEHEGEDYYLPLRTD